MDEVAPYFPGAPISKNGPEASSEEEAGGTRGVGLLPVETTVDGAILPVRYFHP